MFTIEQFTFIISINGNGNKIQHKLDTLTPIHFTLGRSVALSADVYALNLSKQQQQKKKKRKIKQNIHIGIIVHLLIWRNMEGRQPWQNDSEDTYSLLIMLK